VFERGLAAAGLHVPKGALLWEAYTEFEVMVLSLLQVNSGLAEELTCMFHPHNNAALIWYASKISSVYSF